MTTARIQAVKESPGLTRQDNKRPDGVTLIPWSHGRCLAWDVTVPDTVAASHLDRTSVTAGAAAEHAAQSTEVLNKPTSFSIMTLFLFLLKHLVAGVTMHWSLQRR